jgi:predicted membrane-bound spermidine synthase
MRRYLYLGVFFAGMTSLAVELSASRLLGNYFGTSNLVWACIIGLVLIYLTIGYTLGGNWADKSPNFESFFGILAWAALLVGIVPLAARPILRYASQAFDALQLGPMAGTFIAVLLLFSAPVILLGTASPFAIRLGMKDKRTSGSFSGKIYAISTIGSFLGTFLPVLWLIPTVGTYRTFIILSTCLLAFSLLALWRTVSARAALKKIWMPILLLLLSGIGLSGTDKVASGMTLETESAYNYIQVLEVDGMRYLRLNEGQGIHSVYQPGIGNYHGAWEYVLAAPFISPNSCNPKAVKRIAILGLAAGTSAREAIELFPNVQVDGFEIDPKIAEIGWQYFAMPRDGLNVVLEDARWGLAKSAGNYDVVSIDAFRPPYIPWQLTTLEFFQEVKARMSPSGVLVLNVVRMGSNRELVNTLAMTIKQVFPTVMITDIPVMFNSILFATNQSTNAVQVAQNLSCLSATNNTPAVIRDVLSATLTHLQPEPETGILLTDDHAPVEWLTTRMLIDFVLSGKTKDLQ